MLNRVLKVRKVYPNEFNYTWNVESSFEVLKLGTNSYDVWFNGNGYLTRANSIDGVKFNHYRLSSIVHTGTGLDDQYNNHCIIKESDTSYKMWASIIDTADQSTRIGYYTSTDGITWDNGQVVINLGASGTGYDTVLCLSCHVIKESESSYKMWYTGWNGNYFNVIYCTSTNGISWSNFQLAISYNASGTGYDSVGMNQIYVIKESGTSYKMWATSWNGVNERILYCTSTNGITWGNYQLVVGLNASGTGYDTLGVNQPCIIKESESSYRMYYTAYNGTWNVIYCTSTNGTSWSNYSALKDLQ